MKAPLSYVPALPAAIGIIAGILADKLGAGIATAVAGGALFVVLYCMRRHYPALCALTLATGALLAMSHRVPSPPPTLWGETHTFTAEVTETRENATTTNYISIIRSFDSHGCQPIPILVSVNSVADPLPIGAVIGFTGKIFPFKKNEEVPFETDFAGSFLQRGIAGRCYLNTPPEELTPPTGMKAFSNEARLRIFNAIVDSPVNGQTASFLVASLLGDRNYITPDGYSGYRDTGVAHILALSGLHVGIIASLLGFLLIPLRLCRGGRYLSSCITATAIWGYAVIAGLTPSILRAAVMITVFIMARLIGRGTNGYNSLSISVVAILCVDPASLFTPGFQLSVAAVATILMFGSLLPDGLRRYPTLYYIVGMLVTSISAMIGTGIICAYYFNIFPLLFLPANVLTGVLFPLILGGGIVLSVFTAMGIRLNPLGYTVDLLHSMMQRGIDLLGSIDEAVMHQIFFSAAVIVPYALAVIMLALSLHYRKRALWIMTVVFTVATFITTKVTTPSIPSAEIYIPSSLSPTTIIMRAGDKAWLYTTDSCKLENVTMQANERYRRFLLSRGCGDRFIALTDTLDHTTFGIRDGMISAVERTIVIVGQRIPEKKNTRIHVDYALICPDFRGNIDDIKAGLRPDTLLLGTDLHPARRKSLIRQCADSIPYRDLHVEAMSEVW